mgnify:FL=1
MPEQPHDLTRLFKSSLMVVSLSQLFGGAGLAAGGAVGAIGALSGVAVDAFGYAALSVAGGLLSLLPAPVTLRARRKGTADVKQTARSDKSFHLLSERIGNVETVTERKIRYDSGVVEYACVPLDIGKRSAVLFHAIREAFAIEAGSRVIPIPKGSYTIAYYWTDRPYNLYFMRDGEGRCLGAYFNIVRNTTISGGTVCYEDLIIDCMALPDGEVLILDEHELPEPLDRFENGYVRRALDELTASLRDVLSAVIADAAGIYRHDRFVPWLKPGNGDRG